MIKALFLDNFRGFTSTVVRLVDVNFLVGENSSGKTSVLDLLRVLTDPSFFMGPSFGGTQEARFGHFNEIVSAHSEDRTYFRVGLIDEREYSADKKKKTHITGMLVTYVESSGIPKIKQLTYASASSVVSILMQDDKILFRAAQDVKLDLVNDTATIFEAWKAEHLDPSLEWSKLAFPVAARGQDVPIYIMLHWIFEQAKIGSTEFRMSSMRFLGFAYKLIWIAPIRTKPRRTYDEPYTSFSSEGSHTPYTIRRMLGSIKEAKRFGDFMKRVGKASGLFQAISIKTYGSSDDAPFEVDAILDGKPLNLSWVGYGVSQSLPIFVELLDSPRGSWFAIQQPEVHLHPRAQASLGDVFFEMATKDSKRFVIETHSDFTIDRFRMNYRQQHAKVPNGQILFFERIKKQNTVVALPFSTDGDLPENQPRSYRDFFVREEMRILGL